MKKGFWILLWVIPLIYLGYVEGWAQEIRFMSPEVLKELIEKKDDTILIVDTQPISAYKLGHIKGAVNFPWAPKIKSPDLSRDRILVLYCDCTDEEDSIDLAKQLLRDWEYVYVRVLKGGWAHWQKVEYPIEKTKE